ncbi:unnamed protein product [Mucor hiemalis]
MKFFTLLPLFIALISSLVNSLAIPYEDMSDLEIAQMYIKKNRLLISNNTLTDSAGAITYPKNNDTWYIGEKVNVTFASRGRENQTVSIFFFQKTNTLAGGSLVRRVFEFIVPAAAVSDIGGTSLLLAVRRENRYLQTVDSIVMNVVSTKPT